MEAKSEKSKRVKPVHVERRKIFIRNVGKDCVHEDFQEKVESVGEVTESLNPEHGFCWSERSACAALRCWQKRRWPL